MSSDLRIANRDPSAAARSVGIARSPAIDWRAVAAGPAVAAASLVAAYWATSAAGLPLRDPDGVASARLLIAGLLVAGLMAVDVAVRALLAGGVARFRPTLRDVVRERWTVNRVLGVSVAVLSFFASYFAYRNLKSVVPLLRPDADFDTKLTSLDRTVFLGHDPPVLLHQLLGTGAAAHALSSVYLLFFLFIPASLAVGLVFSSDLRAGLFYSTAFSINWLLGAASYYVLPSLGPFEASPGAFAGLPSTATTQLQSLLLDERLAFVRDPAAAGAAQSIGAFASLHVSVYVTAALAVHLLGFGRLAKAGLWLLVALTVAATIYLGWHYVIDDVGGVLIAVLALACARAITGFDLRAARRRRVAASPGDGF